MFQSTLLQRCSVDFSLVQKLVNSMRQFGTAPNPWLSPFAGFWLHLDDVHGFLAEVSDEVSALPCASERKDSEDTAGAPTLLAGGVRGLRRRPSVVP